jgi:DNA polymerase I-like protein with 3'-5' exonuclease and polymerase domains
LVYLSEALHIPRRWVAWSNHRTPFVRTDSYGMFWQDLPVSRKHGERVLGPMPTIPDTGWTAPKEFPNIKDAPVIGLDVETYDPHLKTMGPGWARRRRSSEKRAKGVPAYLHPVGSLVGVSVAAYGKAWYFPLRHTIRPETNLQPENVLAWLNYVLSGHQPKIGANLIYDVGWLQEEGVTVNGPLWDVSYAEALLSEIDKLSLDAISEKYLFRGKETNLLYQWCKDWYGGSSDQRKNIWRAPPCLVGPYAEADALLPLRIFEIQKKKLEAENLYNVFDIECRLTRLLIAMRYRGVRVDLERAAEVDELLSTEIEKSQHALDKIAGTSVDVNKAASIAIVFDKAGLKYPLTPKTKKPSFTKTFLEGMSHPVAKTITETRHFIKLRDTFIRSYIVDAEVGGRIHGQFHSMRNESFGTRSGRLSSSNPNLQNIPTRTEQGKWIRSCFIPDEGKIWTRYDYAQIEYRLLLHFAVGEGAEIARQEYHDNPDLNYHASVQQKIKMMTGRDIGYKPAKNINFGLIYGMGKPTLADELGLPIGEANALFRDYHASVPYVKSTMDFYSSQTQAQGYVETLLGRRSRFDLWESTKYNDYSIPTTLEKALYAYGEYQIQRAGLHKSLNRLLQGSAADILKLAMLACYENGLFKDDGLPMLTVHDELDFSAEDPRDPIWKQIQEVMETVIPIRLPIRAEREVGPNWGELEGLK